MRDQAALTRFLPLCVAALAGGCAVAPPASDRAIRTTEPPVQGTAVQTLAEPWLARGDGKSGFAPLARGTDALGARLRLIDAAERSVDLQSFLIKPDLSSRLMAARLVAAADRGVRVRILVDDIFTTVSDRQFAALDDHPNIEVRIFNPLPRSVPMPVGFLLGLPASNRRMHNKSFTVDNAITIVGGRNNADEYFEVEETIEFADFDVMGAGRVAPDVSDTFDLFWNSDFAVELATLPRSGPSRPGGQLLAPDQLERAARVYDDAVASPVIADLRVGALAAETAPASVVTDRPAKLRARRGRGEQVLVDALNAELAKAEREVLFVTPYFVPRTDGVAQLRALRERGVEVTVITNSLASTNHAAVHGGYAPHRRDLLEAGVRLHEARPDTARSRITGDPVRLTLHTKGVVIDRKLALVGSLNLDPRSTELNTEMGIFIESAPFAGRLADAIEADLPRHTFAVRLDPEGRLFWEAGEGDDRRIWRSDPDATFWRRFVAGLVAVLPLIENQL
jgi:putative cardiolipin synthase